MKNNGEEMIDIDEKIQVIKDMLGKEIGVSEWIKVDQVSIDKFAELTMDPNFIHVDPIRTKAETPFSGTIAHGFFVLSYAVKFSLDVFQKPEENSYNLNYGFNKLRFVSPVLSGSEIRGRFKLSEVSKKGANGVLKVYDLTIEVKGSEKPAVFAEWLTLTIYN